MTVGVDVVVVSHRTPEYLRRFVTSFAEVQWEVPSTLHIINEAPNSDDMEACFEIASAGIIEVPCTYSETTEAIGFSRCCNSVASALPGEASRATVAMFTADMELSAGVLDNCHWQLSVNPELAAIAPKQVDRYGQLVHAGIVGTNTEPRLRGRRERDDGQYDELRLDVVSLPNAGYFVRRIAWDELSGCATYQAAAQAANVPAFGPLLPIREGGSTFFSLHARKHGWKVGYQGNVALSRESDTPVLPSVTSEVFRAACYAHDIDH